MDMTPVTPEEEELFSGGKSFADILTEWENRPMAIPSAARQDEPLVTELEAWWLDAADKDIALVLEKYREYGNTALLKVGQELAELMGKGEVSKAEAQELGVYFFMVGKMARWKNALLRGQRVSRDTLDDLAIYATMGRRIFEKGGWPVG